MVSSIIYSSSNITSKKYGAVMFRFSQNPERYLSLETQRLQSSQWLIKPCLTSVSFDPILSRLCVAISVGKKLTGKCHI